MSNQKLKQEIFQLVCHKVDIKTKSLRKMRKLFWLFVFYFRHKQETSTTFRQEDDEKFL